MNYQSIEYAPISLRKVDTLKCTTLTADNITFDDVKLDDLVCNTVESKVYTEDTVSGELLKKKNTAVYYAGDSAGASINAQETGLYIGTAAGATNITEDSCVAIGNFSQRYTSGGKNTSAGDLSLQGVPTVLAASTDNTCVGYRAGADIDGTSIGNTCVGSEAGQYLLDCNSCTFIGYKSGPVSSTALLNSVCVGRNAAVTQDNTIAIGNYTIANSEGEAVIGNSAITSIVNGGNGTCDLGASNHNYKDCYLGGNLQVDSINDYTPSGGIFNATASCPPITAVPGSYTLFGSGVGTLTFPANTINVGDSHTVTTFGRYTNQDNNDTLTISILYGGDVVISKTISLITKAGVSTLNLRGDITFRSLGPTGEVVVNLLIGTEGAFNHVEYNFLEVATVDTEVDRVFDIRAQVIGLGGTSVQSLVSTLKQSY